MVYIGLVLLGRVARLGSTYLSETIGWTATNRLRENHTRHVLHLDMPFHYAHPPGDLIERIDGDVTTLTVFFSRFVIDIVGNTLLLIGMLILLFREQWIIGAYLAHKKNRLPEMI